MRQPHLEDYETPPWDADVQAWAIARVQKLTRERDMYQKLYDSLHTKVRALRDILRSLDIVRDP